MANEAVIVDLYGQNNGGDKIRYTCASGVAIPKGTILDLSDPRTAAASTSSFAVVAGIAAMDKESDDLSTSISAYQNGVFELVASGAIAIGEPVTSYGADNKIISANAESNLTAASYGRIIGIALEDATAGETINVRVNL